MAREQLSGNGGCSSDAILKQAADEFSFLQGRPAQAIASRAEHDRSYREEGEGEGEGEESTRDEMRVQTSRAGGQ